MIDNLKYIDNSIVNVDGTKGTIYRNGRGPNVPSNGATRLNTVSGNNLDNSANYDKAFYNNPMSVAACYGGSTANMAANTMTHCGYLYNWYAATAGTGIVDMTVEGDQATGSICPAGFRLPSVLASSTGGPTTNGVSPLFADYPVLSASMAIGTNQAGSGSSSSSNYAGWLPSGAWSGTYAGTYDDGFIEQGEVAYYRSSTNRSNVRARGMDFDSGIVNAVSMGFKYYGDAVRCVMP